MLATTCTDPEAADYKMREVIKWGIQKTRRTLRCMKLEKLFRRGIGTTEVEKITETLSSQRRAEGDGPRAAARRRESLAMLMQSKLDDAAEDLRLGNQQYRKVKIEAWRFLYREETRAAFRAVLREELEWELSEGRRRMQDTINFLTQKYGREAERKVPDTWREINISDRALGQPEPLPPPLVGEGVTLSENAKEVMELPPKTAMFVQIKMENIEKELDKARVKARWHDVMRRN